MNTSTAPTRIREFVAEVATHFDDLSESDRQDLLDDLEQHLLELASEDEAGLAAELTSPAAYAADLRHSAGLPARDRERRPSRLQRATDRVLARGRRLAELPPVAAVVDFLPQLRPAWWVVRAWALLVVLAMVFDGGPWYRHVPIPGRSLLGLLALGAAAAISVKAGREAADRSLPWRLGNAAAGIATFILVVAAATTTPMVEYVETVHEDWQPPVLRHPDGEPITNLYLYDLDGNPITDVLVHDGVGRPVEVGHLAEAGFEDIETEYRRDRFGVPLRHLYPLEQYVVEYDDLGQAERRPRPAPFPSLGARDGPATSTSQDPSETPSEAPTSDTSETPAPPPPTEEPTAGAAESGT